MKTFLRREFPWTGTRVPQDAELEVPTEFCGIHGPGGFITFPDDDTTQIRVFNQVERTDEQVAVNLTWYASRADANTVFHILRTTDAHTPVGEATRLAVLDYISARYTDVLEPEDIGEFHYFVQAIDITNGDILGTSPASLAVIENPLYPGYPFGYPDDDPLGPVRTTLRLDGAQIPYGSGYAVQLIWNELIPGNQAVYQVYRSEDPDFVPDASNLLLAAGSLTTNSYTDTDVIGGRTYHYRIAGVDLTLGVPIPPSTRLSATILY